MIKTTSQITYEKVKENNSTDYTLDQEILKRLIGEYKLNPESAKSIIENDITATKDRNPLPNYAHI